MLEVLDEYLNEWELCKEQGQPVQAVDFVRRLPTGQEEFVRLASLLEACDRLLAVEAEPLATAPVPDGRRAIASYEVRSELGRGGMGIVYKVWDPELRREAALKMLQLQAFGTFPEEVSEATRRFQQEAQVLAQLRHEYIVPVFEARVFQGQPYFVMEHVVGGCLSSRLYEMNAAGLPVIAPFMEKIASAVHHAHTKGILHRDLKPANILLKWPMSHDRPPVPRVSDFGLAKMLRDGEDRLQARSNRAPALDPLDQTVPGPGPWTTQDYQPGTPPYMAPEQFDASFGPIGQAADIWALGVIFYEVLTKQRPFAGRTRLSIEAAVLREDPPSLHKLCPDLPRPLIAIVMKCLEKMPGDRYASAEDLAKDLARWQRGDLPVVYIQPWPWRVMRRLRHRSVQYSGLALVSLMSLSLEADMHPHPLDPAKVVSPDDPNESPYHESSKRLIDDLTNGHSIELIKPGMTTLPAHWRFGKGRITFAPGDSDQGGVTITSLEPSLLEIFPDPALPAYRLHVRLRQQATYNPFGEVGFYTSQHEEVTSEGAQFFYTGVLFADLGMNAHVHKDKQGNPSGYIRLVPALLGNSRSEPFRSNESLGSGILVPPEQLADGSGPWRDLILEVRPQNFRLIWNGKPTELHPVKVLPGWMMNVHEQFPDLKSVQWPMPLRGPIGIYVYAAAVRVQRFAIEPLNPE